MKFLIRQSRFLAVGISLDSVFFGNIVLFSRLRLSLSLFSVNLDSSYILYLRFHTFVNNFTYSSP